MKRNQSLAIVLGVLLVTGIATLRRTGLADRTLEGPEKNPAATASTSGDGGSGAAAMPAAARPEGVPALAGLGAALPRRESAAGAVPVRNDALAAAAPPLPVQVSLVKELAAAGEGGEVRFPLPGGGFARGTVEWTRLRDGVTVLVQGPLTEPQRGFFCFQIPPEIGVAGEMTGLVRFDEGEVAYRVEPGKDRKPELVQRDIDDVMCRNLAYHGEERGHAGHPAEAEHGDDERLNAPEYHPANTDEGNIPFYQNGVVPLQSLPGATGVLYLDFDGEKGPFPYWGSFDAAPSGASNSQIRQVWEGVAEDFAPFNVNVTTDLRVYLAAPANSRQRCILTPTTTASPGNAGVAIVGSYNSGSDSPCWAFYTTGKNSVEVISHELGHALNLGHDGRTTPAEGYYAGHGTGEVGWAPIMGVGYSKNLTQWSKGEYPNPSQTQDDLAIITANNNVDYRADDHGGDLAAATYLEVFTDDTVSNQGVIETGGDFDAFRFTTTASGNVSLTVSRAAQFGNIDLLAEIVSSAGTVIVQANPDTLLNATVAANNLAAGTYFLRVSGVGRGSVSGDGYSDYASLGHYKVSGTVPNGVMPDRLTVAENSVNGTVAGNITPRNNHGGAVLSHAIASGNGLGAFQINSATGQLAVADSAPLDYESLFPTFGDPATIELFVSITNSSNPSLNETVRVVISVADVNEAHSIAGPSQADVFRRARAGIPLCSFHVEGLDQFDSITWSITSGNAGGAFAIGTDGVVTVANSTAVGDQQSHVLEITATDNGPPAPVISASHSITINTLLWNPGESACINNWTQESGVTASQSSTYDGRAASRAVDGNTDGNSVSGNVTCTNNASNSWWEVDLGSPRLIGLIELFNRTDAYMSRLSNFRVTVLDASRAEVAGQSFYEGSGSVGVSELWTLASPVTGRYVRVQFLGNNNAGDGHLSLAEVVVSKPFPTNVALGSGGAVATQSTTYMGRAASRAIDGNTDGDSTHGSVTCTNGVANDWWQVDLGSLHGIENIVFYNRTDSFGHRLSNFKVSVWNGATQVYSSNHFTEPGTHASRVFSLSEIEGIVGDRVKIELLGLNSAGDRYLSLTEVQVYGTVPVYTNAGTWTNAGNGSWSTAGNWLNSEIAQGSDASASFSTLNLTADAAVTLDGGRTVGSMSFGDTTPSHDWILNSGSGGPLTLSVSSGAPVVTVNNQTATFNVAVAGDDGLTKAGAGTLVLAGNNTYTGTTTVAGGILAISNANALGSGGVTLGNGTLRVNYLSATPTFSSAFTVSFASTATLDLIGSGIANNTLTLGTGGLTVNGNLRVTRSSGGTGTTNIATSPTGSGVLEIGNTQAGTAPTATAGLQGRCVFTSATAYDGFAGDIQVLGGGNLCFFNGTLSGQDLTIDSGGYVSLLGTAITTVGALNGGGSITKNASANTATLSVASGNFSGTIAQNLLLGSGTVALTKIGSGTLTLSGTSTYTGSTVVNGGTLGVTGSLGATTVTVQSGGTLAGTGTLGGAVTVQSGGTLAPGSAGTGTLTLSATALTLSGTSAMQIGRSGSALSGDKISGISTVTYGGTLLVTSVGANALQAGDSFQLFSATTRSGSFATITLPGLGAGLVWSTGALATTGTISVAVAGAEADPYILWASSHGLDPATDDPDHDGIGNLLEFYLGGDPLAADSVVLPVASVTATHLVVTFRRSDEAEAHGGTQEVQWGSDLAGWIHVVIGATNTGPDTNGVTVEVVENGGDPDDVIVSIPRVLANRGGLFARLQVAE